ncbi:MAG TPA: DUF6763 family protein [Steroidobacteraceae bacterium]|nr:DUF6763 family protein [Steroidobacteraceae bacterium]
MNTVVPVGRPEIGQWYLHQDKGEMFLVTAFDEETRTIEIQNFDGDLDEIDAAAWGTMPLERAEQPEDWTGPLDDVEVDDLGLSETAMSAADWVEPLQSFEPQKEAWEDETPEEERDPEGEGVPEEELSADSPDSPH